MITFGYFCDSGHPVLASDHRVMQYGILQSYNEQHNLSLDAIFFDSTDYSRVPWLERPAGQELIRELLPGYGVIIPSFSAIYTKPLNLLNILRDFQERGITLHIAKINAFGREPARSITTAGEGGEAIATALMAMQSLSRSTRGEAVSEGMQKRKREGKQYCRFAGYGFAWHRDRRVPNEEEQAVIAKIVQWREEMGCSWYEIAAHLLHCGVTVGSTGREWSPSRVRRAYLADLQRRAFVGCPTS
jgi:DNA invertase Pin-like site-specific DNA recombinase